MNKFFLLLFAFSFGANLTQSLTLTVISLIGAIDLYIQMMEVKSFRIKIKNI